MTNNGIVNIHGKDYMTVARRVELAHADKVEVMDSEKLSITTEVISHNPVAIKATVVTKKGTFTGISSANPSKAIEKSNPYEVAETSAVGRALGFAGYGIIEGIASADEMAKGGVATMTNTNHPELSEEPPVPDDDSSKYCSTHMVTMTQGFSKTKRDENNNPKAYWFHKEGSNMCFGN